MHKTAVDNTGAKTTPFPKLPGLVIKGQGDSRQPVSFRSKAAQHSTSAFALSPKLVKQLKIEEKLKQYEEADKARQAEPHQHLTVAERHSQRRREEQDAVAQAEKAKQDAINAEMSEIRRRYTQFKHCKVSEEAMRVFASYMRDKMTNKQYKKQKLRDLGLAAIDTHVIFSQMERNDSVNFKLMNTDDSRASLKDLNATRPSNYLNSYLERVTVDVKVPKSSIVSIQNDNEMLLNSSQTWDQTSSLQRGSVVFKSKKGSYDIAT